MYSYNTLCIAQKAVLLCLKLNALKSTANTAVMLGVCTVMLVMTTENAGIFIFFGKNIFFGVYISACI